MDNKEINEYLAENLFGLKKGVNFGIMPEHRLKRINNTDLFSKCLNCKREKYTKNFADVECYKKPIDYIKNYQQVLEELSDLLEKDNAKICINKNGKNSYSCHIESFETDWCLFSSYGEECAICAKLYKTIGEAICIAAVGYLKARDKHEN